jgi:uncharacterized protein
LIDAASKSMADDFFKRFDVQMQERYPAIAPAETSTEANDVPEKASVTPIKTENSGVPIWVWAVGAVFVGLIAFGLLSR